MEKRNKIKDLLLEGELYSITDNKHYSLGNVALVKELINSGIKIIQYREKYLGKKEMLLELKQIRKLTAKSSTLFIVNDHVDLCKEVGADGVHLGQGDMAVNKARAILGEKAIIGLSTHNQKQGLSGIQSPLDYIAVGPIFQTTTKPDEPIVGLEFAEAASGSFNVPLVGIGGITELNLPDVLHVGIKSVCMISDLMLDTNLIAKVRRIRKLLRNPN